jgi:hypothetical protein
MTLNLSSNGPTDAFRIVNTITEGMFGISILVIVWLIIYFSQKYKSSTNTITVANIVTTIAAIMLYYIQALDENIVITLVVFTITSIIITINKE